MYQMSKPIIKSLVKTKDVRNAATDVYELLTRSSNSEGMGIWDGPPGVGKTTAIGYVCTLYDGVFIRAMACSTVTSILGDLCNALGWKSSKPGVKRMLRKTDMVDFIIEKLSHDPEDPERALPQIPIFVDEADYCLRDFVLMDILRDIYDRTKCPVIFVGMEDIADTIRKHPRFARRTVKRTQFAGLDMDDVRLVIEERCEVELTDDMIEYVAAETRRNIGRLVIAIEFIHKFAERNGLTIVSRADWGDRPLYFDQSTFGGKPNGKK
jgi:DNA transposition AAA+ family ATPase